MKTIKCKVENTVDWINDVLNIAKEKSCEDITLKTIRMKYKERIILNTHRV